MRSRRMIVGGVVLAASLALLCRANARHQTPLLADAAVSTDPAEARRAIEILRADGPAGLQMLMDAHAAAIGQHAQTGKSDDPVAWHRLAAALDAVAQQHDAYAAGLYWYTDLAQAQAAAQAAGKPILSLRLLGRLDEDLSCANSRFFRTVLYANDEVSKLLRERFILHWKSERPVPRITIDFGDGRKIERTITGNSVHYVLDADGRVIDALPGLYGPKAFMRLLNEAAVAEEESRHSASPSQKTAFVAAWHGRQAEAVTAAWQSDLRVIGTDAPGPILDATAQPQPLKAAAGAAPPAAAAARVAIGKGRVEAPMVVALGPVQRPTTPMIVDDEPTWDKLATLHAGDAQLDRGSRALIAAKTPDAVQAGRVAISKTFVETPLVRLVRNFERSIAQDAIRNEYLLHRQIHQWLAAGQVPSEMEALNTKVYAELFLTPHSDPWLGLVPADTYSALDNEGVCQR